MRVAIVTGGTEGIGLEVSRQLVQNGVKVLLVARRQELGDQAVEELGVDMTSFLAGDVADPETATAAVAEAHRQFGGLDVLINNAAVDFVEKVVDSSIEDVRRVHDVNFFGAVWMLQAAAKSMTETGGGSIVNVASRNALVGIPEMGIYGAAKGALISLTRAAALELIGYDVRVNAVAPGMTRTTLADAWFAEQDHPEEFAAEVAATIPQNRLGEPEEVAAAIIFLASDSASYITGTTLSVDGGYTAA